MTRIEVCRQLSRTLGTNAFGTFTKAITFVLLALCSLHTFAKELAITFDDSPRFANGYLNGEQRSQMLIKRLAEHGVDQVVFFSIANALDQEGRERLHRYADAGHIIANHTYSHLDINQASLDEFSKDLLRGHNLLKDFKNFRKLFRFPYLREGNSVKKRDGVRALLAERDYFNAYVTLKNADWYIESLFQDAMKDGTTIDMQKMSRFYVQSLMESINHFDQMGVRHLGRSPKHVLLLHETDTAALFVGDLVDELRRNGWNIISVEQAYTDDIANYRSEKLFNSNPGRIGEIATGNGQVTQIRHPSLDTGYLKKNFLKKVVNR